MPTISHFLFSIVWQSWMKLDRLFKNDRLKPLAAPPPPSPQMRSFPTPCTPTRTLWSTRAQSTSPSLITVKEVCSPGGQGLGLTPRNCASVFQVQETWWPDPWLRVGWTGPAVCRWNTATTPVMPCCSVTVGTVGCPLSGMHQPVTPPVPSLNFVFFAAWRFTLQELLLLLLLLLCTDLLASAVAATVCTGGTSKPRSSETCELRIDTKELLISIYFQTFCGLELCSRFLII